LNNNKLINEKLICAFCWSVLPSIMKMHGPKNKIQLTILHPPTEVLIWKSHYQVCIWWVKLEKKKKWLKRVNEYFYTINNKVALTVWADIFSLLLFINFLTMPGTVKWILDNFILLCTKFEIRNKKLASCKQYITYSLIKWTATLIYSWYIAYVLVSVSVHAWVHMCVST